MITMNPPITMQGPLRKGATAGHYLNKKIEKNEDWKKTEKEK
jgi:hypothetical protein